MDAKIQVKQGWVYLHADDNKIIKSEKLPVSGDTTIALAKLRTFAKIHNITVVK